MRRSTFSHRLTATRRATLVTAIVLGIIGCGGLLDVSNPGALQEGQLDDPALEQFMINGVIAEFQFAYGSYALWSGVLADETFSDHSNIAFRDFALHSFDDGSVPDSNVYASLQRARQAADDAAERIKKMRGDKAASNLNEARALIYGGYAYLLLGEGFCDAPVNLSAPLSPSELLGRAIARFAEGGAVAAAADANVTEAKDLRFLAAVGAARASLKRGDLAKARTFAALVTDGYERWAYYSANSAREYNAFQLGVRSGLPFIGMQPAFQNLNDPRVPQPAAPRPSLRSNPILPPLKPYSFSGWSASAPAVIEVGTHIRFASGLEARYIGIEVDGPGAAMLAFVNTRRSIGGKPPVDVSGAALMAEFRRQRALDFYLTGQRLGDLRRYAAAGIDLFPVGKYPTLPESYGIMHCFIVPRSERATNPNY